MSTELTRQIPALTVEEDFLAQEALWRLLGRQARLYAPESASLPAETAAALAESLRLTLGADENPRVLLSGDLEEKLRQGQRRLARKMELGKQLWKTACLTLPSIPNRALNDTLRSLGGFWKRYDFRFFAQEVPCDIDYQLSQPVSEQLQGVDYVNEWLRRLCLEQAFLARFDQESARGVVRRNMPDYQRQVSNLFEPVAVNALGLALLGENPAALTIPPILRKELESRFAALTDIEADAALVRGAQWLCGTLSVQSAPSARYLENLALDLRPRLRAALQGGTLQFVFVEI